MKRLLPLLLALLFLLSACSGGEETPPRPAREVAEAIAAGQDFAPEMTEISARRAEALLEITGDDYAELSMFMDASRATSEIIIVVTAASAGQADSLTATLTAYVASLDELYSGYKPEEHPKIAAAQVQRKGLQLAVIVSPDQTASLNSLKAAWGQ